MNGTMKIFKRSIEAPQTENFTSSNIDFFIQHFIQHGRMMLDEMLDWFAPALRETQ